MRVYFPATFDTLTKLRDDASLSPHCGWGFAVTPELRALYDSGEEEEFEQIAFDDAAEASIRLLAAGQETTFPHRRVVVSADVDEANLTGRPDLLESVVEVAGPVALSQVAAIHVDVEEAEQKTQRAVEVIDAADLGDEDAQLAVGDAQDLYLAFYDPAELPFLIELL